MARGSHALVEIKKGGDHMDCFRKVASLAAVMMTFAVASVHAQDVAAIETELTQLYQTAKPTADGTDLVPQAPC